MKRIVVIITLGLLVFGGRASAGDTLWLRIHGAGTTEAGTAVAAIGTDVYVAGTVTNASPDILLVKYHGNGDTVWSRVLNLDLNEKTVGVAVGSDSAPVVCVAVQSLPTKLSLVKFNKNGDTVWTRHRVGFNPTGVAVNASNEVFVFGSSGVSTPYDSLALLRYSASGALMFDNNWRLGPSHISAGCAVDAFGNLVGAVTVSGHSNLLKFDGIGDTLWRHQYADLAGGEFQGVAVAPNNCIVVGNLKDSILHVVKFTPDGSQLWNESLPGQGAPGTYCNVVVDADSNIMAPVTDDQQFGRVMVLNAQGQRVWLSQSGCQCAFRAVALDATGLPVAVSGFDHPPFGCVAVKFSAFTAIAEPANPSTSGAEHILVKDILGPGQAVALTVPRAGSYTISILTETGALLRQINKGYLTAGEFRFAPGKLAAGSYYLRIAGPAGTVQEKFIQLR